MIRWRWVLLAAGLGVVLWSIEAIRTSAAHARAAERRKVRERFYLPSDASILEIRETDSWLFRDTVVDFHLPEPGSPERKLLRQAERAGLQQWRKSRYLFRTPTNDFGYRTLEYLPASGRYRAASYW